MTNVRTLTAGSTTAPLSTRTAPHRRGHRLRAVTPDEIPPVAELLNSGATWLPAPPHSLPARPGQPPMVGYLVLVPADHATTAVPRPATEPATETTAEASAEPSAAAPAAPAAAAPTGDAVVRIDPEQRTAHVQDRPLDLTYLEFELLAHLVAHPHRVHTRDQLVSTVWGYGHIGDGRTVDVHVARLRRKLGAEHRSSIVTVRRVGYKYVPSA
ncbi:regulatory protein [Streptomyces sp. NBRC 110611]|uniref:winged helix-turn-helix domain-containing protein n=1 Tax=Streptomyces sp. NBRC 110611 TaxID=1621259 RepID=UPI00082B3A48|nr:winged helix-turn-helix domain-containing protein [Streptomyces sp. NBRC 110611]GAU69479.1 regulatory protein [Streptomyces sp. NBRC 110611]